MITAKFFEMVLTFLFQNAILLEEKENREKRNEKQGCKILLFGQFYVKTMVLSLTFEPESFPLSETFPSQILPKH
ncbi:hypothetical protein TorRG33x02_298670 [Trema orientale]|uniref:Uncharacterized protein n=1 Tax=Trema orientale TaxID=63057 RepID=A0A2P5C3W8_TREOI|nr:hypothetical protein TorRG33x02_298670 [Trema orientale]